MSDLLVELRPFHQVRRFARCVRLFVFRRGHRHRVPHRRVVMAAEPFGTVVAAGQVDEDAADLGRRQVVIVPRGLGLDGSRARWSRVTASTNTSSVSSQRWTLGYRRSIFLASPRSLSQECSMSRCRAVCRRPA